MRHARFDVNEIAGFILDHLFQPRSELMTNFSFEDVKDHLEIDMDVGISHAAGRDGGDVGRQSGGTDIFGGHPLFIMNPVPIPAGASAMNGQYSIVILHRAELNVVFLHGMKAYLNDSETVGDAVS